MTKTREDAPTDPDDVNEASEESFPASDAPAWTPVTGVHAEAASERPAAPVAIDNNVSKKRFELRSPEGVAHLLYHRRRDGTMVLQHTEVPPALRGRGIAGQLAHAALENARLEGIGIVPRCPYVRAYLERHPEFSDLIRA